MNLQVNNIILGGMYFELDGELNGFNETTGDKIKIVFVPRSWS